MFSFRNQELLTYVKTTAVTNKLLLEYNYLSYKPIITGIKPAQLQTINYWHKTTLITYQKIFGYN